MIVYRRLCFAVFLLSLVATGLCAKGEEKSETPLIAFEDGGKWGFLSATGKILIEPKFDFAGDFEAGFAKVGLENKLRLIDAAGKEQFQFPAGIQRTRGIAEGRIWVEEPTKRKWGLCDTQGKILLEPKFDDVREFSEGLAAVNVGAKREDARVFDGEWGYVNTKGELVIPLRFEFAQPFSEGLAEVWEKESALFIDKAGKVVLDIRKIESDFGSVGHFREGLVPLHVDRSLQGQPWLTRFLSREGKTEFEVAGYADEFQEGLAVIKVGQGKAEEDYRGTHGYIDKRGKLAIPVSFAEAFPFSEGLAGVRTKKTTVWGKGDTWGFINKTGKYRIEPQFNEVRSFRGGAAAVHLGGELRDDVVHAPPHWVGGEWWLIDSTGKKLKRTFVDRKE